MLTAVGPAPPYPPIEPAPTRVQFPDPGRPRSPEVVAMGCDFSPGTVLSAYRSGIFPWPHGEETEKGEPLVLWFSPDPRTIFPLEHEPHWSRSLRRTLRTHPYEVTLDADFAQVMHLCGETRANATWIIPVLEAGYLKLHELGWTHSVEVWERAPGTSGRVLVGGIYGIAIGGMFAGESMFHLRTDASKIAFATLAERLRGAGFTLFDVQVQNPHLESLGCVEIRRREYLARLHAALRLACHLE